MNNFSTYSFQYSDEDSTNVSMSFSAETWHEALGKFVDFMGAVQGYSISDKVSIDMSPYALNRESWSGPVFNPEEEM